MKKFIMFLLLLACGLGLTGCFGKSDKAYISNIKEISGLVTEKGYTGEDFQDNLLGKTRNDIIIAWGSPDGSLFGSFGDVWYLSDESNKQIVVYYDKDGVIEHILLEERYTDSSTDVEETSEKWDLIPMVMVDDVLYLVSAEQLKILINTEFSSIFCYNNCMEQRYNRFIFLQNFYKSQEMPCIRHQIKASPHYLILTSPSDSG